MSATRRITSLRCAFAAALLLSVFVVLRYISVPTDDYGYARDSFLRDVIAFGSCGVAAVVCVILGVFLLRAVRASRIHPVVAVILFLPMSIGTAFLPLPLIPCFASFSERTLFSGDNGFMPLAAVFFMLWFSGAAIFGFLVAVLFFRHSPECKQSEPNQTLHATAAPPGI